MFREFRIVERILGAILEVWLGRGGSTVCLHTREDGSPSYVLGLGMHDLP